MLIILEGIDGAGKSTIAKALEDHPKSMPTRGIMHLARSKPEKHVLVEYERALEQYVPRSLKHVICDRWHVGEMVYGPYFRNTTLTVAEHRHIELFLRGKNALLVHVSVPDELAQERVTKRGDDVVTTRDLPTLSKMYATYFATNEHRLVNAIEVSGSASPELNAYHIINAAEQMERSGRYASRDMIGDTSTPSHMLVVDMKSKLSSPAAPFTPNGRAAKLLTHLPQDVYRSCVIVSADTPNLTMAWIHLGWPEITYVGMTPPPDAPHGDVLDDDFDAKSIAEFFDAKRNAR